MCEILAKDLMAQRETVITTLPTIPDLLAILFCGSCHHVVEDKDDACDWLMLQIQLGRSRFDRDSSSNGRCPSFFFRDVRTHPSFLPLEGCKYTRPAFEKTTRSLIGPGCGPSLTFSARLSSYLDRSLLLALYEMFRVARKSRY